MDDGPDDGVLGPNPSDLERRVFRIAYWATFSVKVAAIVLFWAVVLRLIAEAP